MNIGHQRLLALYKFMRGVPDKRVGLDTWVEPSRDLDTWDATTAADCGTTACAVGWALTMPEFNEKGFTASNYAKSGSIKAFEPQFVVGRIVHLGWTAVDKFFRLDSGDAYCLFMYTSESVRDDHATGDLGLSMYLDNDIDFDTLTDKRLVLMLLRNFLERAGAIDGLTAQVWKTEEAAL